MKNINESEKCILLVNGYVSISRHNWPPSVMIDNYIIYIMTSNNPNNYYRMPLASEQSQNIICILDISIFSIKGHLFENNTKGSPWSIIC